MTNYRFFQFIIFFFLSTTIGLSQYGAPMLEHYHISDSPNKHFSLDKKLNEISGLCFSNDYRLFCHNDEKAEIFQIQLKNGEIEKEFYVGDKTLKGDFEDITYVDGFFYIITSEGDIYRFREGKNEEEMLYAYFQTPLSGENDVEGLCFDPTTNALIVACKEEPGNDLKDVRAFYSFSLQTLELKPEPSFVISLDNVTTIKDKDSFKPSGIAYNERSNTFFVISGPSLTIVEITREGKILAQKQLPEKNHRQPEGITFLKDGTLLISDEAAKKKPTLTFYSLRK